MVQRGRCLGNAANGETSATQARQKVVGSLLAVTALLELSLEFFAFYRKVCCYTKLCTTGKIANLALALYKQAHRWALHAAGRFATRHLAPHHRTQLEAHNAVEDLPCLLRLHELHIYGARLFDGCLDGGLGDLMERDALGTLRIQAEDFAQVPGNRLPFAVFIGCEPHIVCANCLDGLLELGNHLLLVWVDLVDGLEVVFDVDRRLSILGFLGDGANVPYAREHLIFLAQVALNCLGFGGALDDD